MPRTKVAFEAGALSLAQAHELTRAEAECPGSEAELLEFATNESLKALKERARKRRLGAVDPEELHAWLLVAGEVQSTASLRVLW